MPSSGLHGPYRLDLATIDQMVPRVAPGAYALGTERGATFYVACVGRDDDDVAARLKQHVGSYVHFKYRYMDSAFEAFAKECQLYHDFGPTGLHNIAHPQRAPGSDWVCPRCEVLG
jgi:hypothetical protein